VKKLAAALFAAALLVSADARADKTKRLEPAEKDAFVALRVFMGDKEEKEWLKLKTRSERDEWLKKHGSPKPYWDIWYKLDADTQKDILAGDVKIGFAQEEVFMAWGEPAERYRLPGRPASWSEMFVYKFEETPKGEVLIWVDGSNQTYKATKTWQVRLTVDDSRVTEIEQKDGWQ
jgi:hypothetical protein